MAMKIYKDYPKSMRMSIKRARAVTTVAGGLVMGVFHRDAPGLALLRSVGQVKLRPGKRAYLS